MAQASDTSAKIYRYKFSENILDLIGSFSNIHKYDDPSEFREHWELFIEDNKDQIEREKTRLINLGCTKNMDEKMYKSARYYFKNKSTKQKDAKKRRKYVTLDKKFLADMDTHITNIAFHENLKPAYAYNNFSSLETYSQKIDNVVQELIDDYDMTEPEALSKISKTYKNRYFIQQKSKDKKVN